MNLNTVTCIKLYWYLIYNLKVSRKQQFLVILNAALSKNQIKSLAIGCPSYCLIQQRSHLLSWLAAKNTKLGIRQTS